jgi:nucleotide-binding universal stress UspA family protein
LISPDWEKGEMKIRKILFATQFETLWFDALESLLMLRRADLDHVVFLNVIEREKVAMHRGTGYRKNEEIKLKEMANVRFIEWAEDLFEQGMEVGVYIVVGNLVGEIASAVQKEGIDLIVMGHHEKGKLELLLSGSEIIELLRRAETPILVYKYLAETGEDLKCPFCKPLLAVDWSEPSQKAAALLSELEGVIEKINIIHVAEDHLMNGFSAMEIQKFRKESRQKLDSLVEMFENKGIPADPHFYIGDPVTEIEKAANVYNASMIVMGATGKSAWKERWLGSIPKTLSEESVFSSLLVPAVTDLSAEKK